MADLSDEDLAAIVRANEHPDCCRFIPIRSMRAAIAADRELNAPGNDRAAWWALVMGAAASIEDASNCLRDPDAKRQAESAAKHFRDAANALWTAPVPQAPAHSVGADGLPLLLEPAGFVDADGDAHGFGSPGKFTPPNKYAKRSAPPLPPGLRWMRTSARYWSSTTSTSRRSTARATRTDDSRGTRWATVTHARPPPAIPRRGRAHDHRHPERRGAG